MILILLSMLFCHIVADYNLQGWLAQAKQKEWWEKNAPDKLYAKDYLMALFMHSLSWTFMIHAPIFVYAVCTQNMQLAPQFLPLFIVNIFCHAVVDDEKANKKTISLCADQILHLIQIGVTFMCFVGMVTQC